MRRPLLPQHVALPRDTLWTSLQLLPSTPSTNAELAERARKGAAHGTLLVAEEQTAGRGRRDRTWSAPAHSSLMVSALVRPRADPALWGWLPLLTAVAVAEAVQGAGAADTEIKWPNDVLVAGRKIAGVLCEVVPGTGDGTGDGAGRAAVVAGWGLNVDQAAGELPGPQATSLRLAGADTDRGRVLHRALERWSCWYRRWDGGDVAAVRTAYESLSSTLGAEVRALLPTGATVEGRAVALADSGGLVIRAGRREVVVAAADVVHLRPVLPP